MKKYLILMSVLLGLYLGSNCASAATVNYYVDPLGTNDLSHGTSSGTGAWASIQYAVTNVSNPTTDTIIINIAHGTYITNNSTITINRSFTNLTLLGTDASTTIIKPHATAASATTGVFSISGTQNVTIQGVTIRDGYLASSSGPGIYLSGGNLTLRDCVIDDNDSGGSYSTKAGIYAGGTFTMENCTVSNNDGSYSGGFTINGDYVAKITGSTFYNNTGPYTGNIGIGYQSTLIVTNTTVTGTGYGITYFNSAYTKVYIKNSIVYTNYTALDLYSSTSKVEVSNSIIKSQAYTYATNGVNGNLVGSSLTTNMASTASYNGTDNGTMTYALSSGSVAIDAGSATAHGPTGNQVTPPTVDQRGKSVYGSAVDIGAVEYQGGDDSDPLLSSATIDTSNAYITINFNEAVYTNSNGTGVLEPTDFTVTLTQGIGQVTAASISSLKTTSGGDLSGGETSIRAYLSLTGTARGVEKVSIAPASRTSIYDAVGNSMSPTQTTGDLTLTGYFEYYVDPLGTNDGSHGTGTGANAWATIQYAITNVSNPTTAPIKIYVASGTYITGNSTITINRGFTNLVIQGAGAQSTIVKPHADPASATTGVFSISGTQNVTISDITIRDGYLATGDGPAINTSTSTLTLRNCIIDDNDTGGNYSTKAGIYAGGTFTMENCTVSNNGGPNYPYSGGLTTSGNYIFKITNSTFYNNVGAYTSNIGAGYQSTVIVTNSTITGTGEGIGTYNDGFTAVYVKNSLIYGTDSYYSLDLTSQTSKVSVTNSIIKNQAYTYATNGINGNLVGNPLTVNLAGSADLNGSSNGTLTYAISSGSVAINAGSATVHGPTGNQVTPPTLDQRGASRDGTMDIGAYEYNGQIGAPTVSSFSPVDNATGVLIGSNLTINFSEAVDAETGNIIIYNSNGSVFESKNVTTEISGSGTSTITIDPTSSFLPESSYYVLIDATAFDDVDSNSFAGISSSTTWNFTTENKQNQTITFDEPPTKTYGDAPFDLTATANSGLPVSYSSSNLSVATVAGSTVTIVGAGSTTITASQAGNSYYNAATNVEKTLTVNAVIPTLTTTDISDISPTTAASGGNITANGWATVTARGVCWNTSTGPTIANDCTSNGTGNGIFTSNLSGLTDNTTYYIRAYATNSAGTSYGNEINFLTLPKLDQTITFNPLANKTYGDEDFDLTATAGSGLPVSYTSSDESIATISGSTVTITGVGTTTITASQGGNNNYNPAEDVEQILTVNPATPTLTTTAISGVTPTTATSGGNITDDGGSAITSRGICWSEEITPAIGDDICTTDGIGSGEFISSLTDLTAETAYYVRAYATNGAGIAYGNEISFVTNSKYNQIITFDPIETKTYGGDDFELTASSDSALPILYTSSNEEVATVSGSTVTIIGIGTTTITASQEGNEEYNPAASVDQPLTVNPDFATISNTELLDNADTSASITAEITVDGGAEITARGVCWDMDHDPDILGNCTVDGTGIGEFVSSITGLSPMTTYYVRAYGANLAGTSYGDEISFTTEDTFPIFSNVIVSLISNNSATITWDTDIATSSKVSYGLTPGLGGGRTTEEENVEERVFNHSITITGLSACTTYYYAAQSITINDSEGSSDTSEFVTTGCTGDSEIIDKEINDDIIFVEEGGAVELLDEESEKGVRLTIPIGFAPVNSYFQIMRLDENTVLDTTTPPVGYIATPGAIYEFKALTEEGDPISEFDENITISMEYTDEDVANFIEESLNIFYWNGESWTPLDGCVVDTIENVVTCQINHFSAYGLFGEEVADDEEEEDDDGDDSTNIAGYYIKKISKLSVIPFEDISQDDSSYTAIEYLYRKGIIKGKDSKTFDPDQKLNRAALAKMAVISAGRTPSIDTYNNCFLDVSEQWYASYICFAKENGWIEGYESDEFKPIQNVNKAEMIKMLLNTHGYEIPREVTEKPYEDVELDSWYLKFVIKAKEIGLIEESDILFNPQEQIDRKTGAEYIYQLIIKEK